MKEILETKKSDILKEDFYIIEINKRDGLFSLYNKTDFYKRYDFLPKITRPKAAEYANTCDCNQLLLSKSAFRRMTIEELRTLLY